MVIKWSNGFITDSPWQIVNYNKKANNKAELATQLNKQTSNRKNLGTNTFVVAQGTISNNNKNMKCEVDENHEYTPKRKKEQKK